MIIKNIQDSDKDAYFFYRKQIKLEVPWRDEVSMKDISDMILYYTPPRAELFLFKDGNKIKGDLCLRVEETYILVELLCIRKSAYGTGVAKFIMEYILERQKNEKLDLVLDVLISNTRAISFYKKYGFEIQCAFSNLDGEQFKMRKPYLKPSL